MGVDAGVPVGVGVGVGASVGVGVGVGVGAHADLSIVLVSNVTAPFRASVRPFTMVAPVSSPIEVKARMLPLKAVSVPRVAELPTCQNTLQDSPLMKLTELSDAVVSVLPIWKMKTAAGSPSVLSVTVPVS